MSLWSATYVEAGRALRTLETFLTAVATWADETTAALETKLVEINGAWFGEYPRQHAGHGADYLAAVKPLGGACSSAATSIGTLAASAEQFAISAAGYERVVTTFTEAPFDPVEASDQIARARTNLATAAVEWRALCRAFAGSLTESITVARACATAIAVPAVERTVAPGGDYTVITVAMAHIADVPLSWVDPSGYLQQQADEAFDDFLASDDADLVYTVLETANQENILESDDKLTKDDLEAATDPARVRELLLAWGRATGTTFGEADLDMMTASIVASAWMMLGSDRDRWKDVDDTLEPEAELTAVLADQAVEAYTSSGVDLLGRGPMPSDPVEMLIWAGGGAPMPESVDAAIESGNLNLYVNGPSPIQPQFIDSWDSPGDWFRNIVFDWEAFYGENASAGGAAIQVLGVLPFGKGARALRLLGEAGQWSDEVVQFGDEFAELGDEGIAALDGQLTPPPPGSGGLPDVRYDAPTIADLSGPTGDDVVARALDEAPVFDEIGVEPWTYDETLAAINTPPSQLTAEQATVLQHLREEIGLPVEGDILQRVVPYGQSELMIANNANGYPTTVLGFASPANDVTQFRTPAEVFDGLGLGYADEAGVMQYSPDDPVVRAIRFPVTEEIEAAVDIPRVTDLGGSAGYEDAGYRWPFTGNGFISSPDHIVPEVHIADSVAMPPGSEMWELAADGSQRLVGVFDGTEWVRVGG